MMHEETFQLLRHIEVHGPRTRPEMASGLRRPVTDVTKTLNNLVMLGYLAKDDTTAPISFALTNKARSKLAVPFVAQPKSQKPRKPREAPQPGAPLRRANTARPPSRAYQPPVSQRTGGMATPYSAAEYQPSCRPGAMQAFELPSRFGDQLRYRDGRVTDMAGIPIDE